MTLDEKAEERELNLFPLLFCLCVRLRNRRRYDSQWRSVSVLGIVSLYRSFFRVFFLL